MMIASQCWWYVISSLKPVEADKPKADGAPAGAMEKKDPISGRVMAVMGRKALGLMRLYGDPPWLVYLPDMYNP